MNRATGYFLLLTLPTVLVGTIVRMHFAAEPLWVDELHTTWTCTAPLNEIIQRAGQGNQSPSYFLLQWIVNQVFGFSELSIRTTSITCSGACILAAAYFVWNRTRQAAASAVTALLVACDSILIFYGSEARPYAMLHLVCLVQFHNFFVDFKHPPGSANPQTRKSSNINWPLTFTTALLPLIHLTGLFLIASEIIVVALFPGKFDVRRTLISFSLAMVPVLLVFPLIFDIWRHRFDWVPVSHSISVIKDSMPALVGYLAIPWLLVLTRNSINGCRSPNARFSLPIACSILGLAPMLLVIALDVAGVLPAASSRYVSFSALVLAIVAGLLSATFESKKFSVCAALVIVVAAICLNPLIQSVISLDQPVRFRQEDWKSVVARLDNKEVGILPLIFLFANLVEDQRLPAGNNDPKLLEYLRFPLTSAYLLPENSRIIPMPTITSQARWNRQYVNQIKANQGAQIVARTSPELLAEIIDDLDSTAASTSCNIRFEIETQPHNVVTIVNIFTEE